jgi:hypothetical protein
MLVEGGMLMEMTLDNELRCQMKDAMLLQLAQPTLANVLQLSKHIEMNTMKE